MMKLAVLTLVAARLILPAVLVQTPTPSTQGNAKTGEALYFKYGCYECHGYSGQNGPGARLVAIRMTMTQFVSYVRNPTRMPPYTAKVVSDAQMADLYAYI